MPDQLHRLIYVMNTLKKTFAITALFLFSQISVFSENYSPTNLPQTNFILLGINQTTYKVCAQDGCKPVELPGHMVTQNFPGQYIVYNGWGQTRSDSEKSYLWDVKKRSIKQLSQPEGIKKWLEYSTAATYVLNDGSVIGEFMYSAKRNDAYIRQPGKATRKLSQFSRFRGSHDFLFTPDGSYIFRDAPGTMKEPTAPFTNQVKGYPQTIYYGKTPFSKPTKLITRPGFMSLARFNKGRHISYYILGNYKKREYRELVLEITDIKTGKSKQLHRYIDKLGKVTADYDSPAVFNFVNAPYLIYEAGPASQNNDVQHWYLHNIETDKKTRLQLPEGYHLLSTVNKQRIMNDQFLNSNHIVAGKWANKKLRLQVLTIPDLKPVFATETDLSDFSDYSLPMLFHGLLKAEYVVHGQDPASVRTFENKEQPIAPSDNDNPFTGTWNCNLGTGTMTIEFDNGKFIGTYSGGSLEATYYNNRKDLIMGEWQQADKNGYVGFYSSEDGNSLSGFWNYSTDSDWQSDPWNCTRQ